MELKLQIEFIEQLLDKQKEDYFNGEAITYEVYLEKQKALREVRKSLVNLSTIRGLVI